MTARLKTDKKVDCEELTRPPTLKNRLASYLGRRFVQPFLTSSNPPWFDARGAAVGLLIGFAVPVGAQFATLGLTRLVFRFNLLIAFVTSWVSNPFTMLPTYYVYYYVGSMLLGLDPVMDFSGLKAFLKPLVQSEHFWESFQAFLALSRDFMGRWFAGAALFTVIGTPLGYVISYRLLKNRCLRRARKLGVSYEHLVADLERRMVCEIKERPEDDMPMPETTRVPLSAESDRQPEQAAGASER